MSSLSSYIPITIHLNFPLQSIHDMKEWVIEQVYNVKGVEKERTDRPMLTHRMICRLHGSTRRNHVLVPCPPYPAIYQLPSIQISLCNLSTTWKNEWNFPPQSIHNMKEWMIEQVYNVKSVEKERTNRPMLTYRMICCLHSSTRRNYVFVLYPPYLAIYQLLSIWISLCNLSTT